jgi:hypothetical protein
MAARARGVVHDKVYGLVRGFRLNYCVNFVANYLDPNYFANFVVNHDELAVRRDRVVALNQHNM